MKTLLIVIFVPFLFACKPKVNNQPKLNDWQNLDLNVFKISIPKSWNYQKQQWVDSFVGNIIGPNVSFSFDFSEMGYGNGLVQTEQEFLKSEKWRRECYFCKSGITYVNNQIPDREAQKSIHIPTAKQKAKYPKADYIADLTYKDSTIYIPIELPAEIKNVYIHTDSAGKYIIKTIWPKIPAKGMTGIYIKSKSSTLNFQMSANNLSKQDQDLALQAFKTIVIKNSK